MLDRVVPLANHLHAGHYGTEDKTGVEISVRSILNLWQVAGWDDFNETVGPLLKQLGFSGVGDYRQTQQAENRRCWRIAPDRIWLEHVGDLRSYSSADFVTLDLSHARVAIILEGPKARDVLAQVVAVDVSTVVFCPGQFIQTGILHVGVLIHCIGSETFEIMVPLSWAESISDFLLKNAAPYGYQVVLETV